MIPLTTYISNADALFSAWKQDHPSMTMADFYEFLCSPTPERELFLSIQSVEQTVLVDFFYLSV